ncbi:MAG TPA: hypothetical protein VGN37_23460 [Actinocatenispora sp.]
MTSVDTQQRDRGVGEPGEQRREFLRAFTEQGWARPGVERPTARPHVTLIVATVATLFALLGGVAMQLIKPVKLKPSTHHAPAGPTVAATWSAVAGWDCAAADDRGFTVQGRQSTWATIGRGGWLRNGCHGDYEAVPLTDKASGTAPSVEWWFRPAAAMRRCRVLVLVPATDGSVYQPVHAVTYSVLNGPGGSELARFTIDQGVSATTWVPGGTYPVGDAGITVRLSSAGKPPSPRAGLAVAQVKVGCTG